MYIALILRAVALTSYSMVLVLSGIDYLITALFSDESFASLS